MTIDSKGRSSAPLTLRRDLGRTPASAPAPEGDFLTKFHHAWGEAKDRPGYDKKAWGYVQEQLRQSGYGG